MTKAKQVTKPKKVSPLATLVERAARNDPGAVSELFKALHAEIDVFVRSNSSMVVLRSRPGFEDDVRNLCVAVEAKVCKPEKLQLYLGWQDQPKNREKSFEDWLRIVAKNTIRDYLRQQLGPRSDDTDDDQDTLSAKELLTRFAHSTGLSRIGESPRYTVQDLIRRLLEFAQAHLSDDQLKVLDLHLQGESYDEIDEALGWEEDTANHHWRSGVEKLRRHFR